MTSKRWLKELPDYTTNATVYAYTCEVESMDAADSILDKLNKADLGGHTFRMVHDGSAGTLIYMTFTIFSIDEHYVLAAEKIITDLGGEIVKFEKRSFSNQSLDDDLFDEEVLSTPKKLLKRTKELLKLKID